MMKKPTREDLDFEHSMESLKSITARVRSTRPLVHQLPSYTITQLKQWGLLETGQTNRHVFDDEHWLVTTLASKHPALKIRIQKRELIIALVSRPLRTKGLVWYFRDPSSGRLAKAVYLSEQGLVFGGRAAGALYASQFQSKSYRQILRMDQLILDIDGDRNGRIGPARGASKLKKLADLGRIFADVRAADRERGKVLAKFPQLYYTICSANMLLKRELGTLHKSWVPPQAVNVPKHGHYSANGLDVIPRSS